MSVERLEALYADISCDRLIYVNCLAEPFFEDDDGTYMVSLETNLREKTPGRMSLLSNDYYTAQSLKDRWEAKNGLLPDGMYLKPIIPFSLGGDMVVKNMVASPLRQLLDEYRDFRVKASALMSEPMGRSLFNKRSLGVPCS